MATAAMAHPVATIQTPPMVSGEKPVVGHAVEYMKNPINFLERGYREHGRVFACKLGTQYSVVALGPENNKFFFGETDKLLSIREGYPFFLKMFSKDFYFFAPKDEYMKQREVVMPKFKGDAMRSYVGLMAEETEDLMKQLGDEGEFDLIPTLGPLVMNIAAHAFLGRDFRGKLDDGFFEIFRDFSGGMEVIWPLWMPLSHLRKSRKARKHLDKILSDWIRYRRENPMDPPDFFQNLIGATFSDGTGITEEVAINIILLLVWAGHETTAGQISWALIDLLQHPEYLEQVRQQTNEVMAGRATSDMTWQDARDVVDMEIAVKESERMHPVAYVLARRVTEDIELDGYRIPKDTTLMAAPCVSHRMPEVFPDPHVYNPRRFESGTGEAGPEANRLIGFGGGLHRCAGVNFARLEVKMVLTMLVRHYEMGLLDAARQINSPMTQWPAQPCRVRYKKRTDDSVNETVTAVERAPSAGAAPPSGCPFHQS